MGRSDDGELRYFIVVSILIHLALLLGIRLASVARPGGGARPRGTGEIELTLQAPPPNSDGAVLPPPGGSDLLCMRDCKPTPKAELALHDDPANAPPAPPPYAPEIVRESERDGVKVVRYRDGGRLFSSTIGPQGAAHLGRLGLLDLADGLAGAQSGREACALPTATVEGTRSLVLLVDTSATVGSASTACAAALALSALDRGDAVEIFNFSTRTLHQPPTRDAQGIYDTLSTIQRRGTVLLDAEWPVSARAYPRDFALISDTAIWNVGLVLPSYRAALLSHAGNRAFLYLVGDGWLCKQCEQPYVEDEEYRCGKCPESTREVVDALMTAGFELHEIRPAGVGESGTP